MKSRYKFLEKGYPYFITSTVIEWLPVFTKKEYFEIIIKALKFCRANKKLKIYAYVILENHLHLITSGENLAKIIKEFKSFTARKIINTLQENNAKWILSQLSFYKKKFKKNSDHQLWQEGVHPKMIGDEEILRQKMEYLHFNPVKKGYVASPEHWLYSSASNYFGGCGVMEVDRI